MGKNAKYNDIAKWRYSELPNVFSQEKKAETYVVQTSNELQKVLDAPHPGMVLVECLMDKYDALLDLILGGHAIADTDYGSRGPRVSRERANPIAATIMITIHCSIDDLWGLSHSGYSSWSIR